MKFGVTEWPPVMLLLLLRRAKLTGGEVGIESLDILLPVTAITVEATGGDGGVVMLVLDFGDIWKGK